jgi:hypothetical protein
VSSESARELAPLIIELRTRALPLNSAALTVG